MKIVSITLVLQRQASEQEIEEFKYLKQLYDSMSDQERSLRGIHRVTDLAPEKSTIAGAVRYQSGGPVYINESYYHSGVILCQPGYSAIVKRLVAAMLKKHHNNEHEFFYVIAEFEKRNKKRVFRTIAPRTEI